MQSEKVLKLSSNLEKLSFYTSAFSAHHLPFESLEQLGVADDTTLNNALQLIDQRLKTLAVIDIERQKSPGLHEEKILFKEALRLNGLQSVDDVTSYFEYGDIIEIYSVNFTQIYGNLQFMRFCSYDLFTLLTKPFFELYSRNSECDASIQRIMQNCFSSFKTTQPFDVEPHLLREIHQNNKKLFKVHPKWISPLVDANGEVRACVLTNYCIEYKIAKVN